MHTESETINPSKAPPHPNPYNLDTLPEFTKFLSNQLIKTRKETVAYLKLRCKRLMASATLLAQYIAKHSDAELNTIGTGIASIADSINSLIPLIATLFYLKEEELTDHATETTPTP